MRWCLGFFEVYQSLEKIFLINNWNAAWKFLKINETGIVLIAWNVLILVLYETYSKIYLNLLLNSY